MALLVLATLLASACRDPTAGPGWLSGSRPPLPTYRAVRATGPIQVDGRLDEPAWARAERVDLVETLSGRPARYRTRAQILWGGDALYVGFS
ncbi:MAG: hypothetical protein A2V77_04965 [Anaeromyxobacter sp. RBG_16_69_14]|nr:MAG: hypothetical protein A2V77_04965 [Anaeromyxobacter sp. RBG_16_69_14]